MDFVDIFAPPGSGKSTICDPIFGDYLDREIESQWDGSFPKGWEPFLAQLDPLLALIKDHRRPVKTRAGEIPSIQAMTGMLNRNLRRMAVVARQKSERPYIGTGFAMRGIGIGWRAFDMGYDPGIVQSYFWTMPVSLGCAYFKCSPETLKQRNQARSKVAETSWEDRSFQVDLQLPVIEVLKEVLRARGVPLVEIDVEYQLPDESRGQLIEFANEAARNAAQAGYFR